MISNVCSNQLLLVQFSADLEVSIENSPIFIVTFNWDDFTYYYTLLLRFFSSKMYKNNSIGRNHH